MDMKYFLQNLIEQKLEEKVEVDHSRYMRSHGKKARGRGMWMFTSKDMGEPSSDEMVTVNGDLSSAAKEAANKLGTNRVYVMEEVELDEVSNRLIQKVRDRATDRIAGGVGKAVKDPKTGLSTYVPPTEDEKALAQKGVKSFGMTRNAINRNMKKEEVELTEDQYEQMVKDHKRLSAAEFKQKHGMSKAEFVKNDPNRRDPKDRLRGNYLSSIPNTHWKKNKTEEVELDEAITDKDTILVHTHKMGTDTGKYGILNIIKATPTQIIAYDYKTNAQIKFNTKTKRGIGAADNLMIKKIITESVELTEDVHNDLNDLIFDFQKKLSKYIIMGNRKGSDIDREIYKALVALDGDLDNLRTGKLFKIRKGR